MSSTNATTQPTGRLLHLPWWLLLALSAAAVTWFAYAVSQRLYYPHELEWMEGALADHAARVYDGLPIYCEPTPEHVPFLYAPLLFWLGAVGMSVGIDGIVALRLVALGFTVLTALLIGHWVRIETRRFAPGLVTAGLFVAGYGWLAWWYDLARNDSLFVFLTLATTYYLRHGASRRWLWAGLLATLALLAKQSALMWLPAVGVGCLWWDWRVAWKFGVTCVAAMTVAVATMHLGTDGWSTFWLFEMPNHHGWVGDRKLGFWTEDLVPMYPLLALGLFGFVSHVREHAGAALYLAAFECGGLATSYLSRMHVGGFDNVMMYGFAAACVLGGVAAGRLSADDPAWRRWLGPALLLVQFGWLGHEAWQRGTSTL
ncbi:MAG: glycosyltransferase family 39 protein, partial [Planctomycetes bacterium]|nr:glycosyltransferase family 39 protein [Planctomycetota bacterium]